MIRHGVGPLVRCAVVLTLLAGCGEGPLQTLEASFDVHPAQLDFGATLLQQPTALELSFINSGRTPLRVVSVESSAPELSVRAQLPLDVSSGSTRKFPAVFEATHESPVSGTVRVTVDDITVGQNGVINLPFTARGVRPSVQLSPNTLDFGAVLLGASRTLSVTVKNPTAAPLQVSSLMVGSDADSFTADSAATSGTLAPFSERKVTLSFLPTRLGGASASLRVYPCEKCAPVELPLLGEGLASSLEVNPQRLDFGRVSVGSSRDLSIRVSNLGSTTVTYRGATVINNPGGLLLTGASHLPGATLAPGSHLQLSLRYSPTAQSDLQGSLLHLKFDGVPELGDGPKLPLKGTGAQPCVGVDAAALDFGLVAQGMSLTRQVLVTNRCAQAVELRQLTGASVTGGYFSIPDPSPRPVMSGGSTRVDVTFTPRAGFAQSTGTLTFTATDGESEESRTVALLGESRTFAPCQYELAPAELSFGRVQVGSSVTLATRFINRGTSACFLSGFGLYDPLEEHFASSVQPAGIVEPGAHVLLKVSFRPLKDGTHTSLVHGFVNHTNPALKYFTVALSGSGARDCVKLEPATLDFGGAKLSCGPRSKQVAVKNGCTGLVVLNTLTVAPSASPEFTLPLAPTMAMAIAPGTQEVFEVLYAPVDDGEDLGILSASLNTGITLNSGVTGRARAAQEQEDEFRLNSEEKVDVLFVVDNSGSMTEEQQSLAQNFSAFLSTAQAAGVDYRIGVTTTGIEPGGSTPACPGGATGGEHGRLFPADNSSPRIITPYLADAQAVFAKNVQVGVCHTNEQGLKAAQLALSPALANSEDDASTSLPKDGNFGFLRDDARLALVFLSDEEDFSPEPLSLYESVFRHAKQNDASQLVISAIVAPSDLATCPTASSSGDRYSALAHATGGVMESICTPDWANSLRNISSRAFSSERRFALTEKPADATAIAVKVNGQPVTTWTYDAVTNSVTYTGMPLPAGTVVHIKYPLGC